MDIKDLQSKLDNIAGTVTEEEGHSKALLMKVVDQMTKDAQVGDYTAIDELLKNIPEDVLLGFISEVD
tara:strand:+ start:649 stop:852 length:204 start_codon:yes stop_codon:yes gene_type:complete